MTPHSILSKCSSFGSWAKCYDNFQKISPPLIYMLQFLKTGSHFFHKEPFYLLRRFLELPDVVMASKNAKKCQNLAIFQSL